MGAITITTEADGQVCIDMPAGKPRSVLIAALKSGKYGVAPASRAPGVTYADLAQIAEGVGDKEGAARWRLIGETVVSIGSVTRAARGPRGSDPIDTKCLISLAMANGDRFAATCMRAADALWLAIPENTAEARTGGVDDGRRIATLADFDRCARPLVAAEVRALSVQLPAGPTDVSRYAGGTGTGAAGNTAMVTAYPSVGEWKAAICALGIVR